MGIVFMKRILSDADDLARDREFVLLAFLTLLFVVIMVNLHLPPIHRRTRPVIGVSNVSFEETIEADVAEAGDSHLFDEDSQVARPDAENRERVATEQETSSSDMSRDLCSICLVDDKDCTLGCGHRCCMRCAERVSRCPTCRADIVRRIRTFN